MHTTNETTETRIERRWTAYYLVSIAFGVIFVITTIALGYALLATTTADPTTCEMLEDIYAVMDADAVDAHAEPAIAQSASDFMDAVDDHCTD